MFVPVSDEEFQNIHARRVFSQNIEELQNFLKAHIPCAEYVLPDGRSAAVARASFAQTVRQHDFPIQVIKRGDRLFFVRKEG